MATLSTSRTAFYGNTEASGQSFVGTSYNGNSQEVCVTRYKFTTDSAGATAISFKTSQCTLTVAGHSTSNDSVVNIRFIINTSATNYINPNTTKRNAGYGYSTNLSYKLANYDDTSSYIKGTIKANDAHPVTLQPNTTYYLWVFPASNFAGYTRWNLGTCTVTTSGSVVQPSALTVSDGVFGAPIGITLSNSASVTNTVSVACAGHTETLQTESSENSLIWTPSIATYAPDVSGAYATATITTTTYYNDSAIGSNSKDITVRFNASDVGPTITINSVAPDNTGTDAASFGDIFIVGRSKVKSTISASTGAGASISEYSIVVNGITTTVNSLTSNAITSANAINTSGINIPYTVSAIDTRGFSFTQQGTVGTSQSPVYAYENPKIDEIIIFRCDSNGNRDDAGTYISVQATPGVSDLGTSGGNPRNTVVEFKACSAESGGSYNTEQDIDKVPPIGPTIISLDRDSQPGSGSPDKSYTVRIRIKDSLENEEFATRIIPSQKWAIKFNSDASAVAFGKSPECTGSNYLEIPVNWSIRRRETSSPNTEHVALFDDNFVNVIYPVGSIYMSVNSTSPETLFGGTWERITGRFLLAATDNGDSGASQAAGNTGGEAEHTLTVDEIPSHTHSVKHYSTNTAADPAATSFDLSSQKNLTNANSSYGPLPTGGGQAHNNMPPYLAVYVWKRTA